MKKILIAIIFTAEFVATSFAEKSSADAEALNIFKVLINNAGTTSWQKKNNYIEKSFLYKGKEISVYSKSGSVVGLSCWLIDANNLPKEMTNRIKIKYYHHQITDAFIFIYANGDACYYIGLKNKDNYLAIKVSTKNKLHVIKKMRIG